MNLAFLVGVWAGMLKLQMHKSTHMDPYILFNHLIH